MSGGPDRVRNRMADRLSLDGRTPAADWFHSEFGNGYAASSVLIVEDDGDIRELLVTVLGLAGYMTTACQTAESALQALREQTFDLLLTDYALPNHTGGWLLEHAVAEGLIDAGCVIVV